MSSLRLALVGMLLAGCVSTDPAAWNHAPDDQTATRQVIYECKAHADEAARFGIAYGGAVMPIIGVFHRRSLFNECMESRGYRQP